VLDALLGGGMSSRLFVRVRENLALAYSVSSFVKNYHDVGAFGVHAAVDNDRVIPALGAIMDELKRIAGERVPEQELRKVKEFIKGHTMLSLERSGYVAHWAGWQELMLGRIDLVDDVLAKIEEVTADDVLELASRLFRTERLALAVVGPVKSDAHLAAHLSLN
jgi:predicted Zn-dependent peptidase